MDNLTHTLTAVVMARAGAEKLAPRATLALVVAANLPEIDSVSLLGGAGAYLTQHRTWSHSLLGAALLGVALGALFWWRLRKKHPQPNLLRNLLILGWLGTFSHSLLDWATAYGTQLLWPFDRTWYALDWFFIVDLWVLLILLLGIGLPALFLLITEEIGARKTRAGARWGAWLALAACALLSLGRASLHADALARLESRLYQDRSPRRVGAFPTPLSPFTWRGVADTESTYEVVDVTLVRGRNDSERVATLYKPTDSPGLAAAQDSDAARAFLGWARFPHAEVVPAGGGLEVRFFDLRYLDENNRPRVFLVEVQVDSRLVVQHEGIRFAWGGR